MAEVSNGIRSVLSSPWVYAMFQSLLGAHAVRSSLVNDTIRPSQGMCVLDIGCGPAEILDYLPEVKYWGFDISQRYIDRARSHFGTRGSFTCKVLTESDLGQLPAFDRVLAVGVLHHLDDKTALSLLKLAHRALKPGGRLITLDPCFHPGQNPIARFLISRDRGQNVRDRDGYEVLSSAVFGECTARIRHKSGIPYTHCVMECTRT